MKLQTFDYILILIVLFMLLILIVSLLYLQNKKKQEANLKVTRKGKDFLFSSYIFFANKKLTRSIITNYRKRIETLEIADKWTTCRKTMKLFYINSIVSLILLAIFISMSKELYFLLIGVLVIWIIQNLINRYFFENIRYKIINQFKNFLEEVRHHYHEHGMIDEAIYDSIENADYEISLHASKMYEILSAADTEEEIEKYYDVVPNRFFKTFLALCYTVQKFGDKVVDKQSVFLTNLNYLKQEINMDILKTNRMNSMFRSLSAIAIIPIFTMKPIESWAIGNMPDLVRYYKGSYGFVVQIIIFIIVLLAYTMINKMQQESEVYTQDYKFEDALLKLPVMSNLINTLIDKNYSESIRYMNILKISNSRMNVKQFYMRKLIFLAITILTTILVYQHVHVLNRNVLFDTLGDAKKELVLSDKEIAEWISFDQGYMKTSIAKGYSREELSKVVAKDNPTWTSETVEEVTVRIQSKVDAYNDEKFKWWELLVALALGGGAYYLPNLMLNYRKRMMEMDMEDEVLQFHTVILMLMYIEQITVEDILQWMEQFAVVFSDSLRKCLNNFENGDVEALEELKIEEPFIPFARLVDNLILAASKIPIKKAFDELKVERLYYQEKRKQDLDQLIMNKAIFGKLFAFMPIISLSLLYLIIPFLTMSLGQLSSFYSNVRGAL